MKFVNKFGVMTSVIVVVITVLWKIEVKENRWATTQSVVLVGSRDAVYRFVTNVDYMEKVRYFTTKLSPAIILTIVDLCFVAVDVNCVVHQIS